MPQQSVFKKSRNDPCKEIHIEFFLFGSARIAYFSKAGYRTTPPAKHLYLSKRPACHAIFIFYG